MAFLEFRIIYCYFAGFFIKSSIWRGVFNFCILKKCAQNTEMQAVCCLLFFFLKSWPLNQRANFSDLATILQVRNGTELCC